MEFQAGDIALINGHEYIIEEIGSDTVTVHHPDFLDMKSTLLFDGNEWKVMDYDTPHAVIFMKDYRFKRDSLLIRLLDQIKDQNVFSWLLRQSEVQMDSDLLQDITNLAAKKGFIGVLTSIWNKYKVLPNEEGVALLLNWNPHQEEIKKLLKWIFKHRNDIHINEYMLYRIIRRDDVQFLDWLARNGFIDLHDRFLKDPLLRDAIDDNAYKIVEYLNKIK